MPRFYHEELVTARRRHRCCDTRRWIEPGERYWRISGKWDERIRRYHQSQEAYHLCRLWNSRAGECEIPFGGLMEHVFDNGCDVVERLMAAAAGLPMTAGDIWGEEA